MIFVSFNGLGSIVSFKCHFSCASCVYERVWRRISPHSLRVSYLQTCGTTLTRTQHSTAVVFDLENPACIIYSMSNSNVGAN